MQGTKKGDLSKFVEEAVCWRMFDQTVQTIKERNRDVSPELLETIEFFQNPVFDLNSRRIANEKRSVLEVHEHRSQLSNEEVKNKDEGFERALMINQDVRKVRTLMMSEGKAQ